MINRFRMPEGPNCAECIEEMKPWPGGLFVCWNPECSQVGEPVEEREPRQSQADGNYYSSDRMAAAQRVGQ